MVEEVVESSEGAEGREGSGEAIPVPKEETLTEKFVNKIPEYFDKTSREKYFRLTTEGVFLNEVVFDSVVDYFKDFYKLESSKNIDNNIKAWMKLSTTRELIQYYLIEGKSCVPGYLLPIKNLKSKLVQVPIYKGKPLSAKDILHPRDPIFENIRDFNVVRTDEGQLFQVIVKSKKISFDVRMLNDFIKLAKFSPTTKKFHPRFFIAQRESLKAFVSILKKVKPLSKDQRTIIPGKMRSVKGLEVLALGSYRFLLDSTRRIVSCFDVKGGNFSFFFKQELRNQKFKIPNTKSSYSSLRKSSKIVGHFIIRENKYPVPQRVILSFFFHMVRSKKLLLELPRFYTVRDVLTIFGLKLTKAEKLSTPGMFKNLPRKLGRNEEFREIDKMIFVLSDNYELRDFFSRYGIPGSTRKQ